MGGGAGQLVTFAIRAVGAAPLERNPRVRREKVRTALRRRPVLEQTRAKKSQRELRGGWPAETLCELFARGARVPSPQHASSEKVAARMDGMDPVGEHAARKSQGLQPSATSRGDATCEKVAAA